MTKLPVFEMVIDENPESEVEVSFIALVDKPAIEKNFMAFNSLKLDFKTDNERKIISGPAMIPDTLIYRRDENGEYNVYFSKKTIEDIAVKFFKKDYQKNINLFHDPNLSVQGVTVFESWMSDKSRGVKPMEGYEDLPDGTLFISAKIENDEVWNHVKEGKVKGFSVEGYFASVKKNEKPIEDKVFEMISALMPDKIHLYEENTLFMSKAKDGLKTLLANFKKQFFDDPVAPAAPAAPAAAPTIPNPVVTMADYMTKDGKKVSCDKLEMGGKMTIDGQPAVAGDYELEDGTKVSVGEGGLISAVTAAQPLTPEQQMQKLSEAVKKFATGTPEERIANMEIVTRALMEYSFGWQIREQQTKLLTDAAINIYKTKFEAADKEQVEVKNKLDAVEKLSIKQNETIKSLFEIVEQISELPTEAPVIGTRQQFLKKLEEDKDSKLKSLATQLQNLKKAQ
jgi:hypothetical protein